MLYVAAQQGSVSKIVVSLIYGFSVMFLFSASSLYHAFKREENEISFWRKLDHIAIFFMIGGTYTPISYIYLSGYWRWTVILVQWILVLAGFFFKIFRLHTPRYVYTTIYLMMGWIGLVPIREFLVTMPKNAIVFLFAGGVSFTVGTIFYIIKKPMLKPGFGFHEIFHFFILLGGFFHYLLVYTAIAY